MTSTQAPHPIALTAAGKRLADALVKVNLIAECETSPWSAHLNAAAEILMPAEGAGLREAAQMFVSHYPHGINPFLDRAHTLASTALASTQPAVEGPVAAGVGSRQRVASWRCPDCRCHTFAAVDEQKADGSFGPGPLIRCVNCKGTYPATLTPPADPKPTVPGNDAGVREALAADVLHYIQSSESGLSRVPRQLLCRIEDVLRSGCANQPPKVETPRTITTPQIVDFNTRKLTGIAAKVEAHQTIDEGEMCFLLRLARQRMDDLAATVAPKAETPAGVGDIRKTLSAVLYDGLGRLRFTKDAPLSHVLGTRITVGDVDAALSAAPAARPGDGVERVREALDATKAAADDLAQVCIDEGDSKAAGALQFISGFISDRLYELAAAPAADGGWA